MKKTGFPCAQAVLALLLLLSLVGCAFCPPQGPWPMPPGCGSAQNTTPDPQLPRPTDEPSELPPPPHEVEFTVTVPYWSGTEIYIGVADDPAYIKLEPYNEAIFQGSGSFASGEEYYYSRGTLETAEKASARKITSDAKIYDAVLAWQDDAARPPRADFQKGFYIGACHFCGVSFTKGNFIAPIGESMDLMKAAGADYFDIMINWFIEPDYTGNTMRPIYADEFKGDTGWVHATITDEDLLTLVEMAHQKGLKVFLNLALAPENWGPNIPGKGNIAPTDPDLFFENYTKYITHYAALGEQSGIELISIGSENDTLTQEDISLEHPFNRTEKWRGVIQAARELYSGQLTYSVSCLDENRCGPELIRFWDDLDVIGWEWYVPIASDAHEPVAQMKENAERIIENHIKPLSERYQKPVILAEIGWEAYPGSCAHTYGVGPSQGGDRLEQASCYEAVFQAIEDAEYIQGVHAFIWTASLPDDNFPWIWTDSANEIRFSITEDMLTKWYHDLQ